MAWGLGFFIQFLTNEITTVGHDDWCQIFTKLNKEITEDSITKKINFSKYEGR